VTTGILLTHGAGSNADTALLRRLDADLSAEGCLVVRHTLAYRLKRPKGPPVRGGDVADRAGLALAAAELRAKGVDRVVIGGHSYGGRQCSMLLAEQPSIAEALLTLSYPLHPPGKPLQMRTAHFPSLRRPVLAVMGDRDEFATVEEMRTALGLIPARAELKVLAGMGHALKPEAAIAEAVSAWLRTMGADRPPGR
jgi:hypothetical protein